MPRILRIATTEPCEATYTESTIEGLMKLRIPRQTDEQLSHNRVGGQAVYQTGVNLLAQAAPEDDESPGTQDQAQDQ